MGEVYRARDSRLGRDVAIKILQPDAASDPDRLARFEGEAMAVASLNHPNIVTLFSIEESGGRRFLSMELVEGRSLSQLVVPGGIPRDQLFDIALPLTEALAAAHEKGIVHRDLKPGNVMLTTEGRVKVLDFGLAKLSEERVGTPAAPGESTATASVSDAGPMLGTLPYMAPEQVRGQPVDARTDLFTEGVLLHELITGQRPFQGTTPADIASSILRDTPPPVTATRQDLPQELARIVARCLEKDPANRFQSARELHRALDLARRGAITGLPALRSSALPAPFAESAPSIAVLPFVSLARDEENEIFADGLSEELLNLLAKIPGLRVAARTSSSQFKGKSGDIGAIGGRLKVATVLEGSVRKSGKRLRITAQLIRVEGGYHLWSQAYDRELEDIFAVQDDIAESVVRELRAALLGEEAGSRTGANVRAEVATATRGRGSNALAYEAHQQGRFFVDRNTGEDVAKGIRCFLRALDLAPDYALAWAGLSNAYAAQAAQGWLPVEEGLARAREAAEKSLRLEPELAEGHVALGWLQMSYDWDWAGAEASFARALALAPGNAAVVRAAAVLAGNLGRPEEAIVLDLRAVALDPLSVRTFNNLGLHYLQADRLDEAETTLRTAVDLSPRSPVTRYFLGVVRLQRGRQDEARAEFERVEDEALRLLGLALMQASRGQSGEANAPLAELIARHSEDSACQIAEVWALHGDRDRAFEWLERAYAQRDGGLSELESDRFLRSLHDDPRWKDLLVRMHHGPGSEPRDT